MASLAFISTVVVISVSAQAPPSEFSTDCKYVLATNEFDQQSVMPVDACYQSAMYSDVFSGSDNSFKWQCEFDSSVNQSVPVHYRYIDSECQTGESVFTSSSVTAFNCTSDIACPFARIQSSSVEGNEDIFNCSALNGTLNETIIDRVPVSTTDVEITTYVLNVCHNNGIVLTCTDSMVYAWMYNDAQCTEYNSTQVFEANNIDCSYFAFPAKTIIAQCDMSNVADPFATPSPTEATMAPSTSTASPTTDGGSTSSTASSTEESSSAHVLSFVVNLIVLCTVCMFVIVR